MNDVIILNFSQLICLKNEKRLEWVDDGVDDGLKDARVIGYLSGVMRSRPPLVAIPNPMRSKSSSSSSLQSMYFGWFVCVVFVCVVFVCVVFVCV